MTQKFMRFPEKFNDFSRPTWHFGFRTSKAELAHQALETQPYPIPMKPARNLFILTATSALLLAPAAFAADGTWNTTATPSSWSTPGNWLADTADGAGFTALFNALDITTDPTVVNLDGARTIGNLTFGDTGTGTAASWTLATGTEGPLTLDAGLLSPTITVEALGTGKNATITANLEGTNGLTKTGTGPLVLNFAPTTTSISGAVVLSQGNLVLSNRSLTNATSVAINAGTFVVGNAGLNAVGGTISFNGGIFQYNVTPVTDYSSQFSTADNQQYRITVINARTATFSTPLTSAGGFLLKDGQGNLTLDAANTFTGSTRVFNSTGTLTLTNALALQNSPLDTTSSIAGTIVLSGVTSPTFGGLTGDKQLSTMFNSTTGNYGSVTNVTLNPGSGADHTYSGAITDGAEGMTLTKSGAGRQVLGVANSYTGGTIINGGTLNYGNAAALSSGPITFTGESILQAGVATTLANDISVNDGVIGTFGTSGFATSLSGAITGNGTFAKGGSAVLTLTGGEANTISGGVIVYSGRLEVSDGLSLTNTTGAITVASGAAFSYSKNFASGNNLANDITISGAGNGGFGALNLWGNVNATGAITLAAAATISHTFNNATISGSITGTDRNLTLSTLNTGQPGMLVSAPITLGTGGITVQGVANTTDFSIHLTGNNSYSGETRVQTGTLKLSGSARIPNVSTVRIDAGAVLHLDFTGTDTVGALYLGGDPNPKPAGTYGSLTSAADNKSADFAGAGILQVGGGGNNFANWASTNGIAGEPFDGDFNHDGITNGVAYALGLSPTASSQPAGTLSGSTITFTKGTDAIANGDVTWIIETSETLSGSWLEEVTQAPGDTTATISYNLNPVPGTPKKFARLKVVKAP
jgi:autotransporter-associated beta strand protein